VAAGQPFVGRHSENIDTLWVADSLTNWTPPTEKPLPWDGGTITGNLKDYTWTYTELDFTVKSVQELQYLILSPEEMHFNVTLENVNLRRYLSQVFYTDSTASVAMHYCNRTDIKGDSPNPVTIPFPYTDKDSVTVVCANLYDGADTLNRMIPAKDQLAFLYNLTPQQDYSYEIMAGDSTIAMGTFHTDGRIRMIHAPGANNIRDLGGWMTNDGKQIKYGRIFRGGELNGQHAATPEAIQALRNVGIKAEIDLRHESESGAGISEFDFNKYDNEDPEGLKTYYYTNNSGCEVEHMWGYYWQAKWRREFEFIVKCLKLKRPVYYHCIWGADRTGFLSMLMEGVLGISYDNIAKDYELTSFTNESKRFREHQYKLIAQLQSLDGNTLQEKIYTYMNKNLYISAADIEYFRQEMLEEVDEVTLDINKQKSMPSANRAAGIYDLNGRILSDGQLSNGQLPTGIYIKIDENGIGRKHIAR
jgi:protein tyrosine/serine phosphatase